SLYGVLDHGLAALWRLQSDDRRHARWRLLRIAVAPAAVIAQRHSGLALCDTHLLELLGRGVAVVRLAVSQQLARYLGMSSGAPELVGDVAVPLQAEPGQTIENCRDGGLSRACAIGIFDAQQVLAAVMARVEPVEERSARAANMKEAGRGRGEAGDD